MNKSHLSTSLVKDVMVQEIVCLFEDEPLQKVEEVFNKHNVNHIPVLDWNKKLVGIVSYKDLALVLDWGTKLNLTSSLIKNKLLLESNLVRDIMSTPVYTIQSDQQLGECVAIFKRNKIHALPVLEGETLVGILSIFDLMTFAYDD